MSRFTVRPTTLAEARRFVAEHHSHNDPPIGHIVSVGIEEGERLVAVAIGGRPVARKLQGGRTAEIVRVCVDSRGGVDHACSMAYGAMRKALAALGYRRVITYTTADESATSVRAAGFRRDAESIPATSWDVPTRRREDETLFGPRKRPTGPKTRWVWP